MLSVLFLFSFQCQIPDAELLDHDFYGIYKMDDGKNVVITAMSGNPVAIFPQDESIFGLQSLDNRFTYKVGTSLGLFNDANKIIRFSRNAKSLEYSINGITQQGTKIDIKEKELIIKNGIYNLKGSLLTPSGNGPFKCIILTHGSGPELRDENRGLAYNFISKNIAAFIYDKRGSTNPESNDWNVAFEENANDALAAATLVSMQKTIDPDNIGIYGHSQGGWVAPLAASKSGIFKFLVISAGNVVNPVEQHLWYGTNLNRYVGVTEADIQAIYDYRVIKYEAAITGNTSKYDSATTIAKTKPWFFRTGDGLPGGTFWKENGYYNTAPALSKLQIPTLIISGAEDKYSDTERNNKLFAEIFQTSGNNKVTIKTFPNTNHAFLITTTGYPDEKEIHNLYKFAPGYLNYLSDWVKQQ